MNWVIKRSSYSWQSLKLTSWALRNPGSCTCWNALLKGQSYHAKISGRDEDVKEATIGVRGFHDRRGSRQLLKNKSIPVDAKGMLGNKGEPDKTLLICRLSRNQWHGLNRVHFQQWLHLPRRRQFPEHPLYHCGRSTGGRHAKNSTCG